MSSIGDIFYTLRGEGRQLQADAKREGDRAGQTLGNRIQANMAKSWSKGQLGKGLMQGLGFGAGLGGAALIGRAIHGVTDAIGGAVRSAGDFEQGMLNVNSIAKVSGTQLKRMGDDVLDMAADFGQSQEGLVKGLYDINSSGFAGAQAMEVLDAAARAASAGLTNAGVAAAGITAVLNSYGLKATDAAHVSDVMFQTVNRGVVTFEELSSEIGKTTALASPLGVTLEEVGAALSVMTRHGIDAENATTQLNAIMASVLQPSAKAIALAEDLGIAWNTAGLRAKGLARFLADMIVKTGGNHEAMAVLLGDVRAIRGAFTLGAGSGKELTDELEVFEDVAGITNEVLDVQKKGLNYHLAQLDAKMKGLGTRAATTAIPALIAVSDFASDAADNIEALAENTRRETDAVVDVVDKFRLWRSQFDPLMSAHDKAALKHKVAVNSLDLQAEASYDAGAAAKFLAFVTGKATTKTDAFGDEARDTADDVDKLADELEVDLIRAIDAATGALTEAVHGPAELTGKLAELKQALVDDRAELKKLEAIKNPTAEQRRDILATKGSIAETEAAIFDTRVEFALLNGTGMGALIDELSVLAVRTDKVGDKARELLGYLQKISGIYPRLQGLDDEKRPIGRATGGLVWPGGTFRVGEGGKEERLHMFEGGGGYVEPLGHGSSGQGGPPSITIYNPEPRAAEEDILRLHRRMAAVGL